MNKLPVKKVDAKPVPKMVKTNCPHCKKHVEASMIVTSAHQGVFPMSANRYVCQKCKKTWSVATGGHVAV